MSETEGFGLRQNHPQQLGPLAQISCQRKSPETLSRREAACTHIVFSHMWQQASCQLSYSPISASTWGVRLSPGGGHASHGQAAGPGWACRWVWRSPVSLQADRGNPSCGHPHCPTLVVGSPVHEESTDHLHRPRVTLCVSHIQVCISLTIQRSLGFIMESRMGCCTPLFSLRKGFDTLSGRCSGLCDIVYSGILEAELGEFAGGNRKKLAGELEIAVRERSTQGNFLGTFFQCLNQ